MPRPPNPYADQEGHGARNRGERLTVIANPRAGGGRAGAERTTIERAVARAFEHARIVWTEGPGHATELTRGALAESDIVAALGGDGTCSEVVNGFFEDGRPLSPNTIFTVLPFGTGGDLVRSLEIPKRLEDALWVASTGVTLPLDAGHVRWPDGSGRMFINVLGFGVNAEVCHIANRSAKRFGGQVTFVRSIFQALASFAPREAHWRWEGPDGPGERTMTTLAAFCANGHYCGAGLWVGRDGRMNDGCFDLTVLPPLSLGGAVRRMPDAYRGHLEHVPGAFRVRATKVRLDSELPIEADGEPQAAGPVEVTAVHRTIQVRAGWLRPPVSDEK